MYLTVANKTCHILLCEVQPGLYILFEEGGYGHGGRVYLGTSWPSVSIVSVSMESRLKTGAGG